VPKLQARRQIRAIDAITYPLWSGDSKNYKAAAREGRRLRRKYMQDLHRQATGAGKYEEVPGVDVLRSLDQIEGWFGGHEKKLGQVVSR
jgi:hypothetical protein